MKTKTNPSMENNKLNMCMNVSLSMYCEGDSLPLYLNQVESHIQHFFGLGSTVEWKLYIIHDKQ